MENWEQGIPVPPGITRASLSVADPWTRARAAAYYDPSLIPWDELDDASTRAIQSALQNYATWFNYKDVTSGNTPSNDTTTIRYDTGRRDNLRPEIDTIMPIVPVTRPPISYPIDPQPSPLNVPVVEAPAPYFPPITQSPVSTPSPGNAGASPQTPYYLTEPQTDASGNVPSVLTNPQSAPSSAPDSKTIIALLLAALALLK